VQELASGTMRGFLLAELLFNRRKEFVELSRLYHRPWNYLQLSRMKTCDEVRVLLILNDLLEFESEPMCIELMREEREGRDVYSLLRHFGFVRVDDILYLS
jgi:hypothetical protein